MILLNLPASDPFLYSRSFPYCNRQSSRDGTDLTEKKSVYRTSSVVLNSTRFNQRTSLHTNEKTVWRGERGDTVITMVQCLSAWYNVWVKWPVWKRAGRVGLKRFLFLAVPQDSRHSSSRRNIPGFWPLPGPWSTIAAFRLYCRSVCVLYRYFIIKCSLCRMMCACVCRRVLCRFRPCVDLHIHWLSYCTRITPTSRVKPAPCLVCRSLPAFPSSSEINASMRVWLEVNNKLENQQLWKAVARVEGEGP